MNKQVQNIQQLDQQLYQVVSQSQMMFNKQNKTENNSFQKNIFSLIQQYEYIKQKVGCKPEYLQQFVKNYQEIMGIVNQSIGFNANALSNEAMIKNNQRLQAELNNLELLKRSLQLGFEKQILIYMEDAQSNQQVLQQVKQSIEYMKSNANSIDNSQKQEQPDPITVQSFEFDQNLREYIKNKSKSQPIIIVTTRSNLLNNSTIEYLNDQNKVKYLRLEGVICLCKPEKLKNTIKSFEGSTVPIQFIDKLNEIQLKIYDIINKNQFLRILSLQDYSFYMGNISVNYFGDNNKKLYDSNKKLYSYKDENYQKVFKELGGYIRQNNISVYKENYDDQAINMMCNYLKNNVFTTSNEEQLAANFIKFYTLESPFYKLVNSCLNVLNEGLIKMIEPIVVPLYLSLTKAKQQEKSAFNTTNNSTVTLYRGTSIPSQSIELVGKNKQLVFPAFSSFTTGEDIALKFMKNTKTDQDSFRLLFIVKWQRDVKNPDNNPKYLKFLSAIPSEEEYLIPPFTIFKVTDSQQVGDTYRVTLSN